MSCSLPFKLFALNESIQQTEVYEYARLLANKQYTLSNYQAYKFIYAARLAEHGFTTQVPIVLQVFLLGVGPLSPGLSQHAAQQSICLRMAIFKHESQQITHYHLIHSRVFLGIL